MRALSRLALVLFAVGATPAAARAWREIEPGLTHRAEVIAKFGPPAQTVNAKGFETLAYLGLSAIPGATQVQFRIDPQSDLVDRIDIFPSVSLDRSAIEAAYGPSCDGGPPKSGDCYALKQSAGKSYLSYRRSALAVFFDERGNVYSLVFVTEKRRRKEPAGTPPEPVADNGKDVVETIGGGGEEPTPAAPTPSQNDRFQFTGWARTLLGVGFGAAGYQRDAPDPFLLPYDRLTHTDQLHLRLQYARGDSFEAVASGLISFSLFEQDPHSPGERFNGFNGPARYGVEPELREAYVGLLAGQNAFRVGQQRVAWGKGDFFAPNDVLNARDLRDPVLAEPELLRVPTLMARADLHVGFGDLELVAVPFLQPDRVDLYGSDWALLQPDAPWPYVVSLNSLALSGPGRGINQLLARPNRFADAQAAARFTTSFAAADVALYYQYGFDPSPRFSAPDVLAQLSAIDVRAVTPQLLGMLQSALPTATFGVSYQRRHHAGFDLGTTLGPFALRLDGAYDSARVFYDTTFVPTTRAAAQAVLAVEYQTGELGKTVLVELNYLRVLGDPLTQPLFFYRQNTWGAAVMLRWTFLERLELEVRAVGGLNPKTYLIRPQLSLKLQSVTVRLGGILLDGEAGSQGSYYRKNVSAYLAVKMAF